MNWFKYSLLEIYRHAELDALTHDGTPFRLDPISSPPEELEAFRHTFKNSPKFLFVCDGMLSRGDKGEPDIPVEIYAKDHFWDTFFQQRDISGDPIDLHRVDTLFNGNRSMGNIKSVEQLRDLMKKTALKLVNWHMDEGGQRWRLFSYENMQAVICELETTQPTIGVLFRSFPPHGKGRMGREGIEAGGKMNDTLDNIDKP